MTYNYTICPFEKITQSYIFDDDSLNSWDIDLGSWDGDKDVIEVDGLLAMHYIDGSTEFCADGNTTFARSTDIYHFCGSSNDIVSVHESTECSYTIIFSVNCTVDYEIDYESDYESGYDGDYDSYYDFINRLDSSR